MTSQSGTGTTPLDQYLEPLIKHRVLIAVVTVVTLVFGTIAGLATSTTYVSTASILVSPISGDPTEALGSSDAEIDMATELRIATSQAVIDRVIEELAAESVTTSPEMLADAVAASSPRESRILDVAFEATRPELAQLGADAFARAYLDYRTGLVLDSKETNQASINDRIGTLKDRLTEVEAALARTSVGSNDFVNFAVEKTSIEGELQALQTALADLSTLTVDAGDLIDPAELPDSAEGLGLLQILIGSALAGLVLGCLAAYARTALRSGPIEDDELDATTETGTGTGTAVEVSPVGSSASESDAEAAPVRAPVTEADTADVAASVPAQAANPAPTLARARPAETVGPVEAGAESRDVEPVRPGLAIVDDILAPSDQARNEPETAADQARNEPETAADQARNEPETAADQARNEPETAADQAGNEPDLDSWSIPDQEVVAADHHHDDDDLMDDDAGHHEPIEEPTHTAPPALDPPASNGETTPDQTIVEPGPSKNPRWAAALQRTDNQPGWALHRRSADPDLVEVPTPERPGAHSSLVSKRHFGDLFEKLRVLGATGPVVALCVGDDGPEPALSVTVDLIRSLSSMGVRLLVIDAVLDGPGLAESLGLPRHPGLVDLLSGRTSIANSTVPLPTHDGVDLLPLGNVGSTTVDKIQGDGFLELVAKAKLNYHAVLITTGNIADSNATRPLSKPADGVIVATRRPPGEPAGEELATYLARLRAPALDLISARLDSSATPALAGAGRVAGEPSPVGAPTR